MSTSKVINPEKNAVVRSEPEKEDVWWKGLGDLVQSMGGVSLDPEDKETAVQLWPKFLVEEGVVQKGTKLDKKATEDIKKKFVTSPLLINALKTKKSQFKPVVLPTPEISQNVLLEDANAQRDKIQADNSTSSTDSAPKKKTVLRNEEQDVDVVGEDEGEPVTFGVNFDHVFTKEEKIDCPGKLGKCTNSAVRGKQFCSACNRTIEMYEAKKLAAEAERKEKELINVKFQYKTITKIGNVIAHYDDEITKMKRKVASAYKSTEPPRKKATFASHHSM